MDTGKDTGADGLPLPWAWQKLLAERAKQTGVRRQRAAAAAADGSVSEVRCKMRQWPPLELLR